MPSVKFEDKNDYLVGKSKNFEFKKKHAMFDLDSTLIETKSGKKISSDINDWKFLYKNINEMIQKYYEDDYSIVIITNQLKMPPNDIIKKITNICKKLEDIELIIYVATKKNKFRKPCPGFYYDLIMCNNEINKNTFYCGDAAGRKGDHSDCDYKFALNCNIKFKLPEQIFDNVKDVILPKINYPDLKISNNKFLFEPDKNKEIVIMVGFPGSGKSTIAKKISDTYDYKLINRDTLKTLAKCHKLAKQLIEDEESFIVDNTNPDLETRKFYIDLAKKNNYYITCIWMQTSEELSMHNNHYRNVSNNLLLIPDIAYRIYKKKFTKPSKKEGFDDIIKQDICLNKKKLTDYFYYFLY